MPKVAHGCQRFLEGEYSQSMGIGVRNLSSKRARNADFDFGLPTPLFPIASQSAKGAKSLREEYSGSIPMIWVLLMACLYFLWSLQVRNITRASSRSPSQTTKAASRSETPFLSHLVADPSVHLPVRIYSAQPLP